MGGSLESGRSGPAVPFGAVEFARQPCSDLHDARILAIVMIHPSRQGCCIVSKFFLTVSKISKQIMPVSKFCKQIFSVSKFFFAVSEFYFGVWKLVCFYVEKTVPVSKYYLPVSKFCKQISAYNRFAYGKQIPSAISFRKQFFFRCKQIFLQTSAVSPPRRHIQFCASQTSIGTCFPPGGRAYFLYSGLRPYCRTFLEHTVRCTCTS